MTRDTYLVNSGWGYEEAAVEKLSCTSGSHPEKVTRNAQACSGVFYGWLIKFHFRQVLHFSFSM